MADGNLHVVVAHEKLELVEKISPKQGRAGDAGRVGSGFADDAVGAAHARRWASRRIGHAKFWIGEQTVQPVVSIGFHPVAQIGGKAGAEINDRLVVDGLQIVDHLGQVRGFAHAHSIARCGDGL